MVEATLFMVMAVMTSYSPWWQCMILHPQLQLVDGGEGDDLISLGLARDLVSGGGLKDVHSTMDGVNGDFVESDSYYNDAGVDLVYFKLEDGDRPIDITQLSIQVSETETVVIDVPTGLVE